MFIKMPHSKQQLSAPSHSSFTVSLALCGCSFSATSQSLVSKDKLNFQFHFLSAQTHYKRKCPSLRDSCHITSAIAKAKPRIKSA